MNQLLGSSPRPLGEPRLLMRDRLARDGDWLFRWRSYLPLLLAPLLIWTVFGRAGLGEVECGPATPGLIIVGAGIAAFGEALRLLVSAFAPEGTSGRNTRRLKAFSLVTTGANSLCRNPLYLGNFLIVFGALTLLGEPLLLAVYGLAFWLYYERIIAREEAFLLERFEGAYRAYAAATNAFIPALHRYRRPTTPFDGRRMLRREYTTITAIAAAFSALLSLREGARELALPSELAWHHRVLALVLLAYGALRLVKKRTRWLHGGEAAEAGRAASKEAARAPSP